jgi:cytochrome c-type biogenesis protein CcmH/NrfF
MTAGFPRTALFAAGLVAIALSSPSRQIVAGQNDAIPSTAIQSAAVFDSALEATTTVLASELRCPVCQGNSIQDSPSELAQEMRSLIRDQLRAGKSADEVRAYFVDKYGEWILLAPKPRGLNLVVYLVPFLAVAVGAIVVLRTVRKWTAPADSRQVT